jgi:hypothetical protein
LQANINIIFEPLHFSRKKCEKTAFVFSFDSAWYNRTQDWMNDQTA